MNIRKIIREETLKILNEAQLSASSIAKKIINDKKKYSDSWVINQFSDGFDFIVDEIFDMVVPLTMTRAEKERLSNEVLTIVITTFFNKYKKFIRWDYDEY